MLTKTGILFCVIMFSGDHRICKYTYFQAYNITMVRSKGSGNYAIPFNKKGGSCPMMTFESCSATIDGRVLVNTTPHELTFQSLAGELVTVPTSVPKGEKVGFAVLNAKANEVQVGEDLVMTTFSPTPEGLALLEAIEAWAAIKHPNETLRVIGSLVAANGYPGRVVGMCPVPGFERAPQGQKRMRTDKFTVVIQ